MVQLLLYFGGEEGIRTLVGLPPNGFQDRLVMIDSVSLRILSAKVTETATIEPEPKYIEETVQEI